MFSHISTYRRNSAYHTLIIVIIFSYILLPVDSISFSNWNRDSTEYDELVAVVESEKRLLEQQLAAVKNELSFRDNPESINLNLTMIRPASYLMNDNADKLYTNTSSEHNRNISKHQFREILEGMLQKHLELTRKRIVYSNIFANNNYSYANNTLGCHIFCQFLSFCIIICGVCLLWACTCCAQPRNNIHQNSDDILNGVNLANIPAPIDYNKPYMIKCDSRGTCYASPLNDDEIPPLPSYEKALTCPTHPSPKHQQLCSS
ncbi:hypothetical protein DINM_003009 [Dirofilaria immitis]|nr:hypothetical protein [Dirofilaria immitis]